jgi:hypothetical protein
MRVRHPLLALLPLALLLTAAAGCGGDDNENEDERRARPVAGTYVAKVQGSNAFVSVVAAPPVEGQNRRLVSVFACDARRLCQTYSGQTTGNDFTARASGGGEGQAKGKLTGKAASGTIDPAEGEELRYKASQATATSGLYDLTVANNGRVRGASAAGVALRGNVELPPPGTGRLRLADGNRLRFDVTPGSGQLELRPGQLRLIVLPDRQLRGAGRSRGGGGAIYFARSASN